MLEPASPARKKQRMSSPPFDDAEFDAEAFETLDRIELSMSQRSLPVPGPSQLQSISQSQTRARRQFSRTFSQEDRQRRLEAIKAGLMACDGGKSAQQQQRPQQAQAGKRTLSRANSASLRDPGSTRATTGHTIDESRHKRSSSGSNLDSTSSLTDGHASSDFFKPLEQDSGIAIGFQMGSSMFRSTSSTNPGFESPAAVGFLKASGSKASALITPSKAALEAAAKRMKGWEDEDDEAANTSASDVSFSRPPLASVLNSPGRQPQPIPPLKPPGPNSFSTPARSRNPRAFKSPLLTNSSSKNFAYPKAGHGPARAHPLSSTPIMPQDDPIMTFLPARTALGNVEMRTPERPTSRPTPLGSSGRRVAKTGFVTPFKAGMKPGEAGRADLERAQRIKRIESLQKLTAARGDTRSNDPGPSRLTLKTSGLQPQRYTADDLQAMGIDVQELSQITPATAPFYAFNIDGSQSSTQLPPSAAVFDPAEAHIHLLRSGRTLASSEWVTNHWSMILWKLAGMVCLDPASETIPGRRRWCWEEVLRQLEHRYDRELAGGQRPALRLIAAHDAPAAAPMVLCVSQIIWPGDQPSTESSRPSSPKRNEGGRKSEFGASSLPTLEVTDGWYRLRAQVDEALARACRKGIIRIGRKLAVVGAKLDSQKKDPSEILQAYSTTELVLTGNSTHLAQWHAKLGFQMRQSFPFIATLHSLSPDGGNVSVLDLIVEKVHPIAFIEIIKTQRGERTEGPWNEAEETRANDAWRSRRDAHESKAREELSKKWCRWEGYVDRLERIAKGWRPRDDALPPDHIEDLFEELDCAEPQDVPDLFRKLNVQEAGWLAQYLNSRCERERERAGEEIEAEVNDTCPPRDVRNFRIVVARDANPSRRAGGRRAKVTIWDILSLMTSEDGGGGGGKIEAGQRFIMTNLKPKQEGAWMGDEAGGESEIYLSTKRNSRIMRLR